MNALLPFLKKSLPKRRAWAAKEGLDAYRIYDGQVRGFPLSIDVYGDYWYVCTRSEAKRSAKLEAAVKAIAEALDQASEQVVFKARARQKGKNQYEKLDAQASRFVVQEYGLSFYVNLTDYLDTGLFLDHRQTRRRLGREADGARCLNLFAYTGAFTVHMAAGGAKSTTTVDMSNTYVQWSEDNLKLNNIGGKAHTFERADVFQWLKSPKRAQDLFDLVIIDPPTFSKSKKMRHVLDIQRDYPWIINKTLDMVTPGGRLYFSTNFQKFKWDPRPFRRAEIKEITEKTVPPDFRGTPHRCFQLTKR